MRAQPTPQADEAREKAVALFSWYGVSDCVAHLGRRPNGKPVASDSTVREWIRTRRLKSRNFGTAKKPMYRVKPQWLEEFTEGTSEDAA